MCMHVHTYAHTHTQVHHWNYQLRYMIITLFLFAECKVNDTF